MTYRILHVLDHSIPLHSGYTFRTAAILREQRKLGWETFHMTGPKQGASALQEEEIEGLHFFRTAWQPGGLARLGGFREVSQMRSMERRLGEIVERVRPNIIQAHSPVLNAIPALRTGKRHNIPVVYEIRAFWEDAAVDHGTSREGDLRYRAARALETYAIRKAGHITTICNGLSREIAGRGVSHSKITVIPNAVDTEQYRYSPGNDELRRSELGWPNCIVLGFIGSFYAYEGIDLLLKATARLLPQLPSLRVLLVGGGPREGVLKAQARALGIEQAVKFTGRVPNSEVSRYYDLIDILVYARHPMRLTEIVTPLKPLEAMAQGKLFIASDVGGHRELVRDGETGVLFRAGDENDLAQKIQSLLGDLPRQARVREAGRRFVECERTWRDSVARYAAVFERVTAQSKT
ncbi:MAG: TIGR04063 family PEP-CTERM/XrtA system glycosyltransferase [Burkholderiales bacterium]